MKPADQQSTDSEKRAYSTTFDVTKGNGFIKELFQRIKDVDVPGLGAQLAFFFPLVNFPAINFFGNFVAIFNLVQ